MKIKFRGKTVSDGIWIFGYFFDQPLLYGHHTHIYLEDAKDEEEEDSGWVWVDRPTVGQYINLNDEHDKEIYVGDYLMTKTFLGEVMYHDGSFILRPVNRFSSHKDDVILNSELTKNSVIAGNKFDEYQP